MKRGSTALARRSLKDHINYKDTLFSGNVNDKTI
jgi:hypothetical protein